MMSSSQLKEMVRALFFSKAQRPYLAALIVATVLALYWDLHAPTLSMTTARVESPESADTFIPDGFVLVPIEVQNFESLDSILGKFGVVDLYQRTGRPGAPPTRVATKIKIMRAPLNPSHFAVLVPDHESASLVTTSTPFTVVVQRAARPGENVGTKIENTEGDGEKPNKQNLFATHSKKHLSRITVEVQNEEPNSDNPRE